MNRHLFFFLTLCLFSFTVTKAQFRRDTTNYQIPKKKFIKYLDLRFENGAMLGNGLEPGDELIESSYYNGLDLRLAFRISDPDNVYSNVYRRPYYGFGWYNSTFHNADVGHPTALYFFLTMPFTFEQSKRWTFSYSGAFGLSYNFNPYDSEDNPLNVFVGSSRNCYVHLGLVANYRFSEKWALNGTVGFKHFSNGSYKLPNYGLNLFPITLGVSYKVNPVEETLLTYKRPVPLYLPHTLINVEWYNGSKNYEEGEKNYWKTGVGINVLRQIDYKYRIGLGVDYYYAPGMDERNASGDAHSFALVGSWEWAIMRKVYIPIGVAYYIKRNKENGEKKPYYERVGIRYRITDHINTGVTIKAHGGVADIFEWTVGYTFHHDPNIYR